MKDVGIEILEHPPDSADLNPVENAWKWLNDFRAKRTWKTLDQMVKVCRDAWREWGSDKDRLRKLAHSMPERLRRVIEAKGGHISLNGCSGV